MTPPEHRRRREDQDPDKRAYQPPARLMKGGHRISLREGWRPIQTRRYPMWWWPFEIAGRWQARAAKHLSEELRAGEEQIPDETSH
jgi:hypothetical protein